MIRAKALLENHSAQAGREAAPPRPGGSWLGSKLARLLRFMRYVWMIHSEGALFTDRQARGE